MSIRADGKTPSQDQRGTKGSVWERSGKPKVVFGRDQGRFICFKAIPLGIRCLQAQKVFVWGGFSIYATPGTPPLAARKSSSIHVYSPTHTAPGLLPNCTTSSSAASLASGRQGEGERSPGRAEECRHIPSHALQSALGSQPSRLSTKRGRISWD